MFGWFSGKSQSELPQPTALQTHRTRQIEQLKAFNQNVSEIVRDLEYRVNTTVNGTTISLHITLPPQFPQEKPTVKVSPRVSHPWVNDQMFVVSSPGINNFVLHSDLGKVVREIVEEFHRNPPTMQPQQYGYGGYQFGASPSIANNPPTASMPQPPPYTYQGQANQQPNIPTYPSAGKQPQPNISTYPPPASQPQPNIPTYIANLPMSLASTVPVSRPMAASIYTTAGDANYGLPNTESVLGQSQISPPPAIGGYKMPEPPTCLKPHIQHLSVLELKELLDDEDKLLEMVRAMPEIQTIARDREQYTEVNEDLARSNLSIKPVLEENKKILLEKYDIFNDMKQQYDVHAQHQDELRQKYEPRHILNNLKVAALQAEEESEAVAESFLEGKLNVDQFKKSYMDKKKLSHLRRAKEEILSQMRF